jgi:hypothetical protein
VSPEPDYGTTEIRIGLFPDNFLKISTGTDAYFWLDEENGNPKIK